MKIQQNIRLIPLFLGLFFLSTVLPAQNQPVVIEAEAGLAGSEFRVVDTLGVTAVTVASNTVNSLNPGTPNRVITFQVTFPEAGEYDLYIHMMVGAKNYDDDSFFYGNGFGEKGAATDSDWIRANGLSPVGYSGEKAIVGGGGSVSTLAWKWLNLSKYAADVSPITFKVDAAALTQTFQIGGREDGLYIDKLVFGKTGLFFTVDNLNKGEAGAVDDPNLKKVSPIAKGKSKFLGCAWSYGQANGFEELWNQSTPENAGKWGSVEASRNVMNWTILDSTYHVAKRYKMPFKEHTLIWGAQQPAWMAILDSANQRREIEQWFTLLANRYPDIDYIDVVNEPINNAPNGMTPWGATQANINYAKALGGSGATGWDWILTSFRLARKYFPKAKLIINEYSVINSSSTTQKYLQIIKLLQADSLIDGIGEQAHAFTTSGASTATLKANLDALAATGLPIYLTEFDVDGATDLAQLTEMQRLFKLFWEHPAVGGVTLWGFRNGMWRSEQKAYLLTPQGQERPALTWLKAYVNDTLTFAQSITVGSASGSDSIATKSGTLNMVAQVLPANTTIKGVSWSVSPTSRAKIDANGILTALADGLVTVTATAWDGSKVSGTTRIQIHNQSVSVPESALEYSISVFPNPSENGCFTIFGLQTHSTIGLFDLSGKQLAAYECFDSHSMNLKTGLPKGIYILTVKKGNDTVNRKIAIR